MTLASERNDHDARARHAPDLHLAFTVATLIAKDVTHRCSAGLGGARGL